MPEGKVWVTFERKFEGEACPVFLNDRPLNFTNGKSRPVKLPADKFYLLQCELIGAVGSTIQVTETVKDGVERTIINTETPEEEHPFKKCNVSMCRFLVFEVETPGGRES